MEGIGDARSQSQALRLGYLNYIFSFLILNQNNLINITLFLNYTHYLIASLLLLLLHKITNKARIFSYYSIRF